MQNLPVMNILDRQTNLRKPVHDLILLPIHQRLFLQPRDHNLIMDHISKRATISIFHNNINFIPLRLVRLFKLSDIWMLHFLKHLQFSIDPFRILFIINHFNIDLLNGGQRIIRLTLDQEHFSKSTLP